MNKRNFYLFRRTRRDGKQGYEYIQHLVSPSQDIGLSCSCWPEYAWRGKDILDVQKMKYLISISPYRTSVWKLVQYEMDSEQRSWASLPEIKEYEDLLNGKKFRKLSFEEENELKIFKQKIDEKWNVKQEQKSSVGSLQKLKIGDKILVVSMGKKVGIDTVDVIDDYKAHLKVSKIEIPIEICEGGFLTAKDSFEYFFYTEETENEKVKY